MAAIGPPISEAAVRALTILVMMLRAFSSLLLSVEPINSVFRSNTCCTDLNMT